MDIKEMFKKHASKEGVFKNKDYISPHYTPDMLPFRDEQINEVIEVLAPAISGKRPSNLFIYGKTGTGKTSTVKKVIEKMDETLEEIGSNKDKIINYYVNCRNHNTKYSILLKLTTQFYGAEYIGYSASFVYDKVMEYIRKNNITLILVLDEVDLIKDIDEAIYSFSRANDELSSGGISIIGVSNNIFFKEKLDPRTKSSLCQKEIIFPPYNARELSEIIRQRAEIGFNTGAISESAISIASAICAQESGDARIALMLVQRAGELADNSGENIVEEKHVKQAKVRVEQEVIINMISTLPSQQKLVLFSIASLYKEKKYSARLIDNDEVLYSGDVYNEYCKIAKEVTKEPVTIKWFKQYLDELDLAGIIVCTASGKGVRGNTTLVKLGYDYSIIYDMIKNEYDL